MLPPGLHDCEKSCDPEPGTCAPFAEEWICTAHSRNHFGSDTISHPPSHCLLGVLAFLEVGIVPLTPWASLLTVSH